MVSWMMLIKWVYGRKDPGFMLGLNNTLRWKNFDFNIYFYGRSTLCWIQTIKTIGCLIT